MTELKQSPAAEKAPRFPVEFRSSSLAGVDFAQRTIEVVAVPYEEPAPVEYRGERGTNRLPAARSTGSNSGQARSARILTMTSGARSARLSTSGHPGRRVWSRRFGSLGLSLVMRRWCWPTKTAWARRLGSQSPPKIRS